MVLSASVARAQTCTTPSPQTTPPTFTCVSGVARTLAWDQFGTDVLPGDVFRAFLNTAQVGPDIPAAVGTNFSIQFGATLPVGSYAVTVALVRPGTVTTERRSDPITLVITAPTPSPPTIPPSNLRVVEVIMRGRDQAGHLLWEHTAEHVVPAQ